MQRSTLKRAVAAGVIALAAVGGSCALAPAGASTPDPTLPEPTVPEVTVPEDTTTTTTSAPATTTTTAAAPVPAPHLAQEVDLDCGDPGTFHNMPVTPDDPHQLDADGDGLGCEDASVFPGGSDGTPEPTPPSIGGSAAEGAPQTAGEELPRTGSTTRPLLALGGALLVIGVGSLFVRGRVRTP